jgi:hypothetical protein
MDGIKPPGRRVSRNFSGGTPVSGDSKGEMEGAGEGGSDVPAQARPRNIALDKLKLDAPQHYGLGNRDAISMRINAKMFLQFQGGPSERVKAWSEDFYDDPGKIDPAFKATAAPSDDDADIECRLPMRGASQPPASATSVIAPPTHRVAAQAQAQAQVQAQPRPQRSSLQTNLEFGLRLDRYGKANPRELVHFVGDAFSADSSYFHFAAQLSESISQDKRFLKQVNYAEREGCKKDAVYIRADYLFLRKYMSGPEIGTCLLMIAKEVRNELDPFFALPACSDFTSDDHDYLTHCVVAAIMGKVLRNIPQLTLHSKYADAVKKLLTEIAAEAGKKEDGKSM